MKPTPPIALEDRGEDEGRLFSPSAGRNKADIASVLSEVLPIGASVLEIAGGTGEHGIELLSKRTDVKWQFSDPDETSRRSQAAWIKHVGLELMAPLNLNMSEPETWAQLAASYDAIYCANMIHIAPISALHGLAALAENYLSEDGVICLYGPFLFGDASAPSNLDFDASLKRRNPDWGVRELAFVKHIFAKHGFNASWMRDMPSNNSCLGLSKN